MTEEVEHPAVFGGGFRSDSLHARAMADFEAVVGEHRTKTEPLPSVADENGEFGFAVIGVGDCFLGGRLVPLQGYCLVKAAQLVRRRAEAVE